MTACHVIADSIAGVAPYYPVIAGSRLGWTVTNDSVGGSGFLHPTPTYRERLAACVASAPDVVVVQGSSNDVWYALDALAAEFALFFAALRAGLPSALVYVLSPWPRGSAGIVSKAAMGAALAAAAASVGGLYIDWAPWITGTGDVDTLTGDGNGDAYISTDNVHPNAAGGAYLGTRLAFAIRPPATGLDY